MKKSWIILQGLLLCIFIFSCSNDAKMQSEYLEKVAKDIELEEELVNSCIIESAFIESTCGTTTFQDGKKGAYWATIGFKPDVTEKEVNEIVEKVHAIFLEEGEDVKIHSAVSWSFTKEFPDMRNKTEEEKEKLLTTEALAKIKILQEIYQNKYGLEFLSNSYRIYLENDQAKLVYFLSAPITTSKKVADSINSLL